MRRPGAPPGDVRVGPAALTMTAVGAAAGMLTAFVAFAVVWGVQGDACLPPWGTAAVRNAPGETGRALVAVGVLGGLVPGPLAAAATAWAFTTSPRRAVRWFVATAAPLWTALAGAIHLTAA